MTGPDLERHSIDATIAAMPTKAERVEWLRREIIRCRRFISTAATWSGHDTAFCIRVKHCERRLRELTETHDPKETPPTWGADEFDPEFHCGCDECDLVGHTDADGWRYNPDTGEMLCEACAEKRELTGNKPQEKNT